MTGNQPALSAEDAGGIAIPRQVLDSLPGLFGLVRASDGRLLQWNARLEQFTGYTDGELGERVLADLLAPEDVRPVLAATEQALVSASADCEARLVRADREAIVHHLAAHRVEQSGEPRLLVLAVDVSARHRHEEALRRTHELLTDAIESMPEGLAYFDADDYLLLFNERYRELAGAGSAIHLGAHYEDILRQGIQSGAFPEAADAPEAWIASIQRERREAGDRPRELQVDGERWLRIQEQRTDDGGTVGLRTDITDLKDHERALRESEALYRSLVELSPDAVVVSREGRICFVNPAGVRMAGADDMEAMIGRSLLDFVRPEMQGALLERLAAASAGQGVEPLEYEIKRLDGDNAWIEAQARAIPWEGEQAILTVARDVTERHRAQERYRALFEGALEAIVISDLESGAIVDANPGAERLFGHAREHLLGQPRDPLFPRAGHPAAGGDGPRTASVIAADGERTPVEIETRFVRDDGGRWLAQTLFRDLSERHRRERETSDRYRVLELIARSTPLEPLLGEIARMVERQCDGLRVAILVCHGRTLVPAGGHSADLGAALFDALEGAPAAGETAIPVPDSLRMLWETDRPEPPLCALPVNDADGALLGALVYGPADAERSPARDAHSHSSFAEAIKLAAIAIEQDQLADRLNHRAHHDALTGLPNRSLLTDRVEQAIAAAMRQDEGVALVMLDLDDFKHVNDELGHAAGDQLLQTVALELQDCLRADDTVARLGGDEFVLVLPRAGMDEAAHVANKVQDVLARPVHLLGRDASSGASVGIALFPDDGRLPDTLLQAADTAMYAAKHAGRHCYRFFAETMNVAVTERLRIEHDLRRALDGGELAIHYQPRLSLADGRLLGAEALVRWRHPERGLLHPRDFLGICEQARLHKRLDAWMLQHVSARARTWAAAGRDLRLSLNISPTELHDPGFIDTVLRTLETAGVAPTALEIEITEQGLMRNRTHAVEQLRRLRAGAPGLRIALDDFGRGYSSLVHLRDMPIDTLKIERSFVHELTRPEQADNARALLGSVAELGRNLGLEVVAEGIEQAGQHEAVAACACDAAQGFYYSAPLTATGLEAYADRGGQ